MYRNKKISIVGVVGIPANYGGFETLAENLAIYHERQNIDSEVTIYCSIFSYAKPRITRFKKFKLQYLPLKANGVQSIIYDVASIILSILRGTDTILILGVSGAIILPIVRINKNIKIVTNIDGIEWKRAKWNKIAKKYLQFAEKIAVKFSHEVIVDNLGIQNYVKQRYNIKTKLITYGGDHSLRELNETLIDENLPSNYALALCRIEPENNVQAILDAWTKLNQPLIFVGNWKNSNYGSKLKNTYQKYKNIFLLDPIYDKDKLAALRSQASLYIHGHSAGGTNPSLVEMMHFGIPIMCWDCEYNRYTTQQKALYFDSPRALIQIINNTPFNEFERVGRSMMYIAKREYTWEKISKSYFTLLNE